MALRFMGSIISAGANPTIPQSAVKFGSDSIKDTQYQEGSAPIDFSKYDKPKKKRTPAALLKKASKAYARPGDGILPFLLTVLGGVGTIVTGVCAGEAYDATLGNDYDDYPVSRAVHTISESADRIEENVDKLLTPENSAFIDDSVKEKLKAELMYEVLDHVATMDTQLRGVSDAPAELKLQDFISQEALDAMPAEQAAELEELLIDMVYNDNLDEHRALFNTLMDNYVAPSVLASENPDDNIHFLEYKEAVNEMYEEQANETMPFKVLGSIALTAFTLTAFSAYTVVKEDLF